MTSAVAAPGWPGQGGPCALPHARPLMPQLRPPGTSRGLREPCAARESGRAGRGEGAPSRPAGRPGDAPPAPSRPGARRSPTFSKFNHYLNPKGNEQTSRIGCQGIFSLAGRIYPQVFPQQTISGPRGRFRSADARRGHSPGSRPAAPRAGDSRPRPRRRSPSRRRGWGGGGGVPGRMGREAAAPAPPLRTPQSICVPNL